MEIDSTNCQNTIINLRLDQVIPKHQISRVQGLDICITKGCPMRVMVYVYHETPVQYTLTDGKWKNTNVR